MFVERLVKDLEVLTNSNPKKIFEESGMINLSNILSYGFFPFGNGNLSENETSYFNIMVLGNDFGSYKYLAECIKNDKKESGTKNPTIRNLMQKLGLEGKSVFYTNLHLGVRQDGTNTKRVKELTPSYKEICYLFFIRQLEAINPDVVLCLGHEVRKTLVERNANFDKWRDKSIKALYNDGNFLIDTIDKTIGSRKFILLPHPCDTRNFREEYLKVVRPLLIE